MGGRVEVDAADETALDELRGPSRATSSDHSPAVATSTSSWRKARTARQAPGSDQYERLKAVKRSYDLTNSSRLNQNITPD